MAKTRCVATRIEFFRDFFLNSLLSDYSSYFITFSLVLLLLFKVFLVFCCRRRVTQSFIVSCVSSFAVFSSGLNQYKSQHSCLAPQRFVFFLSCRTDFVSILFFFLCIFANFYRICTFCLFFDFFWSLEFVFSNSAFVINVCFSESLVIKYAFKTVRECDYKMIPF